MMTKFSDSTDPHIPSNPNDAFPPTDPAETKSRRQWTSGVIIVVGVFILLRANIEFIRLQRLRTLVGEPHGVL